MRRVCTHTCPYSTTQRPVKDLRGFDDQTSETIHSPTSRNERISTRRKEPLNSSRFTSFVLTLRYVCYQELKNFKGEKYRPTLFNKFSNKSKKDSNDTRLLKWLRKGVTKTRIRNPFSEGTLCLRSRRCRWRKKLLLPPRFDEGWKETGKGLQVDFTPPVCLEPEKGPTIENGDKF